MPERRIDQASGLRRLFGAAPWRRPVCFVAPDPALARVGMLSLADGFEAHGIAAHVDGRSGASEPPALRLFDDPLRLADPARAADGIDLVVQGMAGPAGITDLYGRIKQLAAAHRVERLGVVLVGPVERAIAERCRANLVDALDRFIGVRVGMWGSLGTGRAFRRAALAGTSVQSLDRDSEESREFERLAGRLYGDAGPRSGRVTH